jgi:ADP-ribose pyrophosphatase YjhB (NUDIX family)
MDDWRFCPRCGTAAGHVGEGVERHLACSVCDYVKYDNPLPTTIGLVEADGRLLLLRRAIEPQRGWWDTVGGFVAAGESAEQAMLREAEEEIGVCVRIERLVGTFSSVYGDTGLRTLGVAFACSLPADAVVTLSAESLEHAWLAADELPPLAFADVQAAAEAWRAGLAGARA